MYLRTLKVKHSHQLAGRLEFTGQQLWTRYVGASGYGVGTASAMFPFYDAPTNTTQSLVLSSMSPSVPGDSLSFDHAYATYQTENDRLIIETSTNGGTTYTALVTLNGGVSGPLVTAPPTTAVFVPSSSQWATKRYALPLGTNRVRFKAVSAYGNYLYLDNFTLGKQVGIDVGAQSIDIPSTTLALPQNPKATVKNLGTTTQTFNVTMLISPGGYSSTRTVTLLASNTTAQVSFDEWTPIVGSHNVTAFTSLAGDLDQTNDTVRAAILANQPQQITNMNAFFRDGQVFVTWDNLTTTNLVYMLYRSTNPIKFGSQLSAAQNLGSVRDNSALNQRLSSILGTTKYLKIDSSSAPLGSNKGLFVATSIIADSFYYAVTASLFGVEDTAIIPGSNSLTSPLIESVMMPKPVWQENRLISSRTYEIYVQYVTKVTSSIYPLMTNVGSIPFHFALIKSGTVSPHPITFWMHGDGGNFLPQNSYRVMGDPNEWVVTIDDWLPDASDATTLYYGYHEKYDIYSATNQIPISGNLYNYTFERVNHTINWALRNLPVDTTRTYMFGWSAGAFGALFSSLVIPSRIAAIAVVAPQSDISTTFYPSDYKRLGTTQSNLMTNDGLRRNDRLNANFLARINRLNSFPILFTFCGKNDEAVGWLEKIPFYDTLSFHRHGGFHFWSMTDHLEVFYNSPWQPTFPNFKFFTRYRTNLSYPAFSNCSINNNPGNGTPSNGDPIGSNNGHLDWNDNIVDITDRWEITLKLKNLLTTFGSDISPDSATTDVTLRRLQNFLVPTGSLVTWENRRNDILVQHGSFAYDGDLITLPAVKVYKDSSRLIVTHSPVSVREHYTLPQTFTLEQNYPNPFNPTTTIGFGIPEKGNVRLSVLNILGEEIKVLLNEEKEAGYHSIDFNASNFPSSVYFYRIQASFVKLRTVFIDTKKMILLK